MVNTKTQTILPWKPIFEGEKAREVKLVIHEIAEALRTPPSAWIPDGLAEPARLIRGASLAFGSAGLALFFAYYCRALGEEAKIGYDDEVTRFIAHARDTVATIPMEPGLFRGKSGIAWAAEHLRGFIYPNGVTLDDPNDELDESLPRQRLRPDRYDLWYGSVGLGVYALERYLRTPLGIREWVEYLVNELEDKAEFQQNSLTWFTFPEALPPKSRKKHPAGHYDLGVAHGVPGVIAFLARVHAAGIDKETTAELISASVTWLLGQGQQRDSGPNFPDVLVPPMPGKPIYNSFGWCHGDPGIAMALLLAGRCLGKPRWENVAVEIARTSVKRMLKAAFPDASLCHGAAGLGHLFNRMYQRTGDELFLEAARTWLEQALNHRKPGYGSGGYTRSGIDESGNMVEIHDPGFIQGTAGIGLALLAAVTPLEPAWDRVMLISSPECP